MTKSGWQEYKEFALQTLGDYKDKTETILFLNLFEEVGQLFGCLKMELMTGKEDNNKLLSEIGDILWCIAILETHYDLSSPRGAKMLDYKIEINLIVDGEADYISLQADFADNLLTLFEALHMSDLDTVQHSINLIFSSLMDMLIYRKLTLTDAIGMSRIKLAANYKPAGNKGTIKDHEAEYKRAKEEIKNQKLKEITLDILTSPIKEEENKSLYLGLKVKNGRKITKFESNELILDYFNASNFIASQLPNQNYSLLYSPQLSAVIGELIRSKDLISAYIYDSKLVPADKLKTNKDQNFVYADKTKYRPVLIKPSMIELEDLLTYISDVKKLRAKKL
jgi:hypothetical protein